MEDGKHRTADGARDQHHHAARPLTRREQGKYMCGGMAGNLGEATTSIYLAHQGRQLKGPALVALRPGGLTGALGMERCGRKDWLDACHGRLRKAPKKHKSEWTRHALL
eukprot:1147499-Pelagomonas_calceolata.AAC.11